ncbi:MAG: MgtC/SapB family protein [Blastocatellales bacterium]
MLTHEQIILRLVLSAFLGSLVGLDRERLDWVAGLRTHMLVCMGAAIFMIVSAFGFADILSYPNVTLDPSRIAAQVVSGIGFLGAGTIILRQHIVHGLTTAASLWAVAAVGLSVGGGLYVMALSATALILIILAGIKPIEKRLFVNRRQRTLTLLIDRQNASLLEIEAALEETGLHSQRLLIQRGDNPDEDRVQITLNHAQDSKLLPLAERLRRINGVREISDSG